MAEPEYLDPPPAPVPLGVPPVRGRVLVVSPHPDDELIGSGGTLLHHRELGDPIHIVILTDGARGDVLGEYAPGEYRRLREAESSAAARRLGAGSIEFLRFPDGARARSEDLGAVVPRLVQEITSFAADVVYAPHRGEIHRDHHVTALAVERAVQACSPRPRLLGYEIWAPLVADYVVDITAHMPEKQAICQEYASQLRYGDIVHYFAGMNAYRSLFLGPPARYGEAFQDLSRDGAPGNAP